MADANLTDPLGRSITLDDGAWFGHVLKRHPEMQRYRLAAKQAIMSPDMICASKSDPDCRVYFARLSRRLLVAVVADVVAGCVRTAYTTKKVKGDVEWTPPPSTP